MAITPNTQPNFTNSANISAVAVTAGSTNSEAPGTIGTGCFLAFTPGANDSFLDLLRWMPTANTAATSTTATVGRVFLSTISSGATSSSNTFLIYEVVLPSVSADSSSAANNPIDVPLQFRIPGSNAGVGAMYLLVSNHVAPAANSQWIAITFASNY
jgi:hypothetical protein